jgi:hypothetical protein
MIQTLLSKTIPYQPGSEAFNALGRNQPAATFRVVGALWRAAFFFATYPPALLLAQEPD